MAKSSPLLEETTSGKPAQTKNCIAHTFFCLLPLLAGGLVLLTMVELGNQNGMEPSDQSLAQAFAEPSLPYPNWPILILLLVSGSLMIVVTLARNIQVQVYFKRKSLQHGTEQGNYTCGLWLLNASSALFNIVAYSAWMALGFLNGNSDNAQVVELHDTAALIFVVGSSLYSALQIVLLFRQEQYYFLYKALIAIVGLASLISLGIYAATDFAHHLYVWAGVALSATMIMLFAILFHADDIDNELSAFLAHICCCFCCCCRARHKSDHRGG